jgi:hypothetical protein
VKTEGQKIRTTSTRVPATGGLGQSKTGVNGSISMTRHPLARVAACKDSLDIHPGTKYKVTDAGAEHDGKDEIGLEKVS